MYLLSNLWNKMTGYDMVDNHQKFKLSTLNYKMAPDYKYDFLIISPRVWGAGAE
jgi:hypothetical protein